MTSCNPKHTGSTAARNLPKQNGNAVTVQKTSAPSKATYASYADFCEAHREPIVENVRVMLRDAQETGPEFSANAIMDAAELPTRLKSKYGDSTGIKAVTMRGVLPDLDYAFNRVVVLLTNPKVAGVKTYMGIANATSMTVAHGKPVEFVVEICGTSLSDDFVQRLASDPVKVRVLESLVPWCRMYASVVEPESPAFIDEFYPVGRKRQCRDEEDVSESGLTPSAQSGDEDEVPQVPTGAEARLNGLDPSQQEAVRNYLASAHESGNSGFLHIIEGPPGTGKTRTLVSLVRNTPATKENKLLVTAPSNTAVQVVALALKKAGVAFVLVGVPEKIPTELHDRSPEVVIRNAVSWCKGRWEEVRQAEIVSDVAERYSRLREIVVEYRQHRERCMRFSDDVKDKLRDIKLPPSGASADIVALRMAMQECFTALVSLQLDKIAMQSATVVLTTLISAGRPLVHETLREAIHTMVVDEAAQSTEPELMIPFRLLPRNMVLVGDIKQLGGVATMEYMEKGYCESSMERLLVKHKTVSSKLRIQYRMHPEIQDFPRKQFYDSYDLVDSESVMNRDPIVVNGSICSPLTFYHVPGKEERLETRSTSRINSEEVRVTLELARQFRCTGMPCDMMGIITFYADQVTLLREEAVKIGLGNVRISTVDAFQGGEYDVIILSFVRANEANQVGFIDPKRLNVALTRARHALLIVGDMSTLRDANKKDVRDMAVDLIQREVVDWDGTHYENKGRQMNMNSVIRFVSKRGRRSARRTL